jgi:hypothetical protein
MAREERPDVGIRDPGPPGDRDALGLEAERDQHRLEIEQRGSRVRRIVRTHRVHQRVGQRAFARFEKAERTQRAHDVHRQHALALHPLAQRIARLR